MADAPTVRLISLGCARNDVDSDELAGRLSASGWDLVDSDDAELVVVNTCGFIESAKAESIETILAASEDTKVVAVGCMAERYGQELATQLPEAAAVIGFDGYADIDERLRAVRRGESLPSHEPRDRRELLPITPVDRPGLSVPPGHSAGVDLPASVLRRELRSDSPVAPLKIASGCDRRCAFCAIPRFRGSFVSRPAGDILEEAAWLAQRGIREVLLVSENSTSYGKDLGDPRLLEKLLPQLAETVERVRITYLQPAEVRPRLLEVIATTPGVASYFDLSFQHASAPLLRRMRRFGGTASFVDMVDQIRELDPEAGIRSNVIVGFPGETEDDVAELLEFLGRARLDAVGVFGYSDEEDTEGQRLDPKVDQDEIRARVEEVTSVADAVSEQRAQERDASSAQVLIQSAEDDGLLGKAAFQGPEDGSVWIDTATAAESGWVIGDLVELELRHAEGVDFIGSVRNS
ncbi:MAG: radical SAM protein [Actinobacteria bacterium]|nr:radical SAM protein [Actinomycetota bacterium]